MAAPSVITEPDNMSTTLTNSTSTGSPISVSQESTKTSLTGTPLLGNAPPRFIQQSPQTSDNKDSLGWPRVAKLMADTPDIESFSRFREMNVKNLLYYQVELTVLGDELTNMELEDWRKRGMSQVGKFAKYADSLVDSKIDLPNAKDHRQWDLVLKMRERLKEYNSALLQHVQISALPAPDYCNVENLRIWLMRPDCGNQCIGGMGSKAWGSLYKPQEARKSLPQRTLFLLRSIFWPRKTPPNKLDLVSARPHQKVDGLTRWVAYEWIPFYQAWLNDRMKAKSEDPEKKTQDKQNDNGQSSGIAVYSERTMLKFTSSVATVVACILPTLAIGVLATAHGTMHALLYIGGFTALFAIGLMFLTNAETTRVEVFTATAAFSAVLVVFVQNQTH